MKTLILTNPIINTTSKFTNFHGNRSFHIFNPKKNFSFTKPFATNSLSYGGWDDLRLGGELSDSGDTTQLPDFILSRGIEGDNKKYIFVFVLGIFCAFAISRVKISSIIVFPASVLIFGVGFSLGFFRGGSFNEFSLNANKKRVKDDNFRVYSEKLRSLVAFFDGFEVKVNELKKNILRVIDTKEIELSDLENYVGVIESLHESALNSRSVVDSTIDSLGNYSNVVIEDRKSAGKKKKEIGEVGSELLQFVGGLFGEKLEGSKPAKAKDKDNVKQGAAGQGLTKKDIDSDQNRVNSSTQRIKLNGVDNDKEHRTSMFSQGLPNNSALNWDSERRIRIISDNAKMKMGEIGGNRKKILDTQEYSYQSSRLQFVDNQRISWKTNQNNATEMQKFREDAPDSTDFDFTFKHAERETLFMQEQVSTQTSGAYESSNSRKVDLDENYGPQFRENEINDDSQLPDHQSVMEGEVGPSSSSMLADDVVFDRYLSEANNLMKQAKEFVRRKHNEENAEIILYKSAKLLSKALAMKPMSLLAVGLLGNTYLLHGELKLRFSRELRTLLLRRDPLSVEDFDENLSKKDKIAYALANVCEECEELLVEAGRKYRLALSIDANDVRALYNWGLALSYRAQLIADIGPEAASDADKVFLAAIDKFDAMMSKGNIYAPDALYRWGVVLQQRSRLRPRNSKEKMKLLMQAKRLYEDALGMDYDNLQVREAISSCVAELNYRRL
ncbi:uncharacterized protein LOC126656043 [Mercurialis annua]|uniref:uncharacterized protein LOC126656043 n=1 Tax=Mercurialis annua TaxID=3986 RepID=UPI00215E93CF|nr:uncharacterized protein LOC126656043 [Mercurialis annua]